MTNTSTSSISALTTSNSFKLTTSSNCFPQSSPPRPKSQESSDESRKNSAKLSQYTIDRDFEDLMSQKGTYNLDEAIRLGMEQQRLKLEEQQHQQQEKQARVDVVTE